jgi:alpha-D-ribose 1-methylphosphonate 5-triphosphate diphosphatase
MSEIMSESFVIQNAQLVLPDDVVPGWIAIADGQITEIGEGRPPEPGLDLAGDLLCPGLVELHTDHLEAHLKPRPKVQWPEVSAVVAYDAQIAASGITTVLDSLRVGSDDEYAPFGGDLWPLINAVSAAERTGILRADHKVHLRCEICAGDLLEQTQRVVGHYPVQLISLMDHTPGTRQFRNVATWKQYYGGKHGFSEEKLARFMSEKESLFDANYEIHRRSLVDLARANNVVMASHDDTTVEHVRESIEDGVAIAEFPTTVEAASASHAAGIAVLMGAPNVVRGGSHSGNVAAVDLAREGVLDILSSDYVPASLLMGAFTLAARVEGYGLARALRSVTLHPARAAGLNDRGAIIPGLRADLVRIHLADNLPVVREVFRGGRRVI